MKATGTTIGNKLPPVVKAMLKQRGAVVDTGLRASRARLIETCSKYRCKPHSSVIAFEAAFGGLLIPDGPKMKKDEPCWLFGAHACLSSEAHVNSSRKLVPVVYSPNDIIYYLNEKGRGYAQDTIEDTRAYFYADNGKSLVCRIVFDDALFSRKETSIDLKGLKGKELSKRLSLRLVKEASGKDRRFFSNAKGDVLVVEEIKARTTRVAASTKKQLKLVEPPGKKNIPGVSAEAEPYLGMSYVRMVGEERTTLPEFFEHLPDLRDLDVSINRIGTLPESLWRAVQITSLDLSFNPVKVIPDGIGNLKALRSLHLRRCPIEVLPDALVGANNLTRLIITECSQLDVDRALLVIAQLPKLKDLSLPLSRTLTSLAPLARLPLKSLYLNGVYVTRPARLPSGLGQLKKLKDFRVEYADDVTQLPEAPEDIEALRLHKYLKG